MNSALESLFLAQIECSDIPMPETECRFHPERRWRFDFAWLPEMIAVEIEGGTWSGGRHIRGAGYERDCEKYNEATWRGWRVFRFTGGMVEDGCALEFMRRVFGY